MNRPIKLFIFEGEKTENRFVKSMQRSFFKNEQFEIVNLPAKQNIYMIYETMKKDDFETDIVEILREKYEEADEEFPDISRQNISEVYLFFDYDVHQNNTAYQHALVDMLKAFDNETENGRLYISYPMVEAVYDFKENKCDAFSSCYYPVVDLKSYKKDAGTNNPKASRHFGEKEWLEILGLYAIKLKCLFGKDSMSFDFYRNNISPIKIFLKEEKLNKDKKCVFVLSAFPEFLFDYKKKSFWDECTHSKDITFDKCCKLELDT